MNEIKIEYQKDTEYPNGPNGPMGSMGSMVRGLSKFAPSDPPGVRGMVRLAVNDLIGLYLIVPFEPFDPSAGGER